MYERCECGSTDSVVRDGMRLCVTSVVSVGCRDDSEVSVAACNWFLTKVHALMCVGMGFPRASDSAGVGEARQLVEKAESSLTTRDGCVAHTLQNRMMWVALAFSESEQRQCRRRWFEWFDSQKRVKFTPSRLVV